MAARQVKEGQNSWTWRGLGRRPTARQVDYGMLPQGVYPALVTPFDEKGGLDGPSLSRLLGFHHAAGVSGIVLAGTNGEGASLTFSEKRDLLSLARAIDPGQKLILGLPVNSLVEACGLAALAEKKGADALLLSPPSFWKRAGEQGLHRWLKEVLDAASVPVLLYHNPPANATGLPKENLEELLSHPMCGGVKNSAVTESELDWWRERVGPDQALWVGDERMIPSAFAKGWNGTISGSANLLSPYLVPIVRDWPSESAQVKFELIRPLLEEFRKHPQPETHKAVLHLWGILGCSAPRLPLISGEGEETADLVRQITGMCRGSLALSRSC